MVRGARRNLWGWTVPSRRLIAVTAFSLSLSLAWVSSDGGPRAPIDPTLVVDANTAPLPILTALPRIGPVLAGRIVDERERRPFRSLAELDARVRGIGPATAAALRPYLRFDPEEPNEPPPRAEAAAR